MLRLEDVYAFIKVAESRSFSRAAYNLCLSKSVVSDRIARLERDVGSRLLARTSRGVSLTDGGEIFRDRCLGILEQLAAAREALPAEGAELTGALRVALPVDYGLKCITRPLARFMAQNPRLECYAEYSDECVDLESGNYDLGLRLGRGSSVSSKVSILTQVESIVVAAPDLVARVGMPKLPAEMQTLPCLTYLGVTDVCVWHFKIGHRSTPINVQGRFRANTMEALLIAAETGLGFATMPYTFVDGALRQGRLCHVLPEWRVFDLVLGAHYPSGNRPSRNAKAFTEFLTQQLGTLPKAPAKRLDHVDAPPAATLA